MKKSATLIVVLILGTMGLFAQSKLSHYAEVLVNNARHNMAVKMPKGKSLTTMVGGRQMVRVYVEFESTITPSIIEKFGGTVNAIYTDANTLSAQMPVDQLEQLAQRPEIRFIETAKAVRINMDKARPAGRIDGVLDGVSPLQQNYLGRGVLVGFVDQEIQVSHINFWSADQSRFRIKRFWNQNGNGSGSDIYPYGNFYTDSASILNKKYDVREMECGHATHVMGMAAGADHIMNYYGSAQESDLAIVSTTGEDATLTDGVQYIFDYADSIGKPCVINISMGSILGPHDGTETSCRILDSMVKPGRLIVGAAGNSGENNIHSRLVFTDSLADRGTFISLNYEWWYPYALVDIWGDTAQDFQVSFVVYKYSTGDTIYQTPYFDARRDSSFTVDVDTANIEFYCSVGTGEDSYNGKGHVYFEYEQGSLPSGCYFGIAVHGTPGTVHMWCEEQLSEFKSNSEKGWTRGDSDYTIGEGIGSADKVITVGSYCTRDGYGSTVGKISGFSSRGPRTDGMIKPEITAPGEVIMSSIPDLTSVSYYREESTTVNGKKYYYGLMQGTSMACPYTTGVIATWMEANPNLSREDVLDIFEHTAIQDKYTGSDLPNSTWGYGKIDALNGLLYLLGLPTSVHNPESPSVIGVYPNPTYDDMRIAFTDQMENVVITVSDVQGREVYRTVLDEATSGEEFVIPMESAAAGIYFVKVNENVFKVIKK